MRRNWLGVWVYDLKSEAHEFVGEGREEAIAKACEFYGVEAGALEISVFPEGEVYGLGSRSVVVARLPGARPQARPEFSRRDRGRAGRDGEKAAQPRRRGRGEGSRRSAESSIAAPERTEPADPSVGTPSGEIGQVGDYVLGIIERMDLGPFEITENREGDLEIFEIRGPAATELARGEGRSVDALQLLANQAAMRLDADAPRVVVDIEGSAEARESLLDRIAKRVARRARESGRSVALDPMNARDRRLVHLALRDEEEIATMSMGEGRYRQVLVVPRGAPEFEEASRESNSGGSGAR